MDFTICWEFSSNYRLDPLLKSRLVLVFIIAYIMYTANSNSQPNQSHQTFPVSHTCWADTVVNMGHTTRVKLFSLSLNLYLRNTNHLPSTPFYPHSWYHMEFSLHAGVVAYNQNNRTKHSYQHIHVVVVILW